MAIIIIMTKKKKGLSDTAAWCCTRDYTADTESSTDDVYHRDGYRNVQFRIVDGHHRSLIIIITKKVKILEDIIR